LYSFYAICITGAPNTNVAETPRRVLNRKRCAVENDDGLERHRGRQISVLPHHTTPPPPLHTIAAGHPGTPSCYDPRGKENSVKSFRMVMEGVFVIAATFLVTLVIAAMTIHAWGWNSGNVASWVQAVGSIAAIIGSYFIGERQAKAALAATQKAHQLAEETRRTVEAKAAQERRAGMYAVVLAAHNHTVEIKEALDDEYNIKMYSIYHPSIIDSMIELLSKLPIHTLGSERAIAAFVIYNGQFTFLALLKIVWVMRLTRHAG
jgi:hypothetical protein